MANLLFDVTVRNAVGDERSMDFVGASEDAVRSTLSAGGLAGGWQVVGVRPAKGEFGAPITVEELGLERLLSIDSRLERLEQRPVVSGTKIAVAVCAGLWLYILSIVLLWFIVAVVLGLGFFGIGRSLSH